MPVWAPDGSALLFSYYDKTTPGTIMRKSLGGSILPERTRVLGRSAATSVLPSLVA